MDEANEDVKPSISSLSRNGRIPRPPNAFMLFANSNRKKLATQFPHDSNKEISCRLGREWKILEPHLKERYFEMAKNVDMEHKRKYPDYVYNPKEARLRKAMRESAKGNKLTNSSAKQISSSNNKKSEDVQNAYQFQYNGPMNSYVQIMNPNSWVQQPQIWVQYPTNMTVPKALVLVPPRVININPTTQKTNNADANASDIRPENKNFPRPAAPIAFANSSNFEFNNQNFAGESFEVLSVVPNDASAAKFICLNGQSGSDPSGKFINLERKSNDDDESEPQALDLSINSLSFSSASASNSMDGGRADSAEKSVSFKDTEMYIDN